MSALRSEELGNWVLCSVRKTNQTSTKIQNGVLWWAFVEHWLNGPRCYRCWRLWTRQAFSPVPAENSCHPHRQKGKVMTLVPIYVHEMQNKILACFFLFTPKKASKINWFHPFVLLPAPGAYPSCHMVKGWVDTWTGCQCFTGADTENHTLLDPHRSLFKFAS